MVPIFLDEDATAETIVDILRRAGHSVTTSQSAALRSRDDGVQLGYARMIGAVLVTKNVADFVKLREACERQRANTAASSCSEEQRLHVPSDRSADGEVDQPRFIRLHESAGFWRDQHERARPQRYLVAVHNHLAAPCDANVKVFRAVAQVLVLDRPGARRQLYLALSGLSGGERQWSWYSPGVVSGVNPASERGFFVWYNRRRG